MFLEFRERVYFERSPKLVTTRWESFKASVVFQSPKATGSEYFAGQDSGPSQIFKVIVPSSEDKLNSTKIAVRGSKTSRA